MKKAAEDSGRSVGAMIRESIDVCYPDTDTARREAAARFLARATSTGPEPDFADSRAAMDAESEARLG